MLTLKDILAQTPILTRSPIDGACFGVVDPTRLRPQTSLLPTQKESGEIVDPPIQLRFARDDMAGEYRTIRTPKK